MRTKKFVDCATTSLLAGLAVNFAVAAGDQHSVNLENEPPKSKYSPGLAAKIVNLKIESDENGIKIDAEGTDGDGNPTHAQYDAKFDGKDYAVTAWLTVRERLDRAAPRLGDAGININYSYCGTEAVTNASILIFGGRCRCDSWVFLREVCIDYAGDVLSEALLDGEDLG